MPNSQGDACSHPIPTLLSLIKPPLAPLLTYSFLLKEGKVVILVASFILGYKPPIAFDTKQK